ncbi:metalloregulator ArsR/SmtB family transcription factor [soil metagenome]
MVQYSPALDATFGALADPSRRAIVERLGRGAATISELAELLDITLTGTKKHVQVLEAAGLVTTDKVGRTRFCRLGPRRLEDELAWIENYRQLLDQRLDRLGELIDRRKGENK